MRKKSRQSRPLLQGHLEKVSSKIFENFTQELTNLIGSQHGVYALYKGGRLYYVGLATDLKRRVGQHTKDKHAKKWDKFSIYLVRQADHIKELEALIMRIAAPKGNTARGKLANAKNLKRELEQMIKSRQQQQLGALLGTGRSESHRSRTVSRAQSSGRVGRKIPSAGRGEPSLAPYVERPFRIRAEYKGEIYIAIVNKSGTIRYDGAVYNSPSAAGRAVKGKNCHGWLFWEFRDKKGEWVKLDNLRK